MITSHMDSNNVFQKIEKLAELLNKQELAQIHYKDSEIEVTLYKSLSAEYKYTYSEKPNASIDKRIQISDKNDKLVSIKTELVGTAYLSSEPDGEAFVRVGKKVDINDVLCIIECMKTMNRVKAPCAGIVKEICIHNGQMVDYNKILMVIDPVV